MRIGILSRNPSLYSTRRLAEAAWDRGHQVRIIDTTSVAVHIGGQDGTPPPPIAFRPPQAGVAAESALPPLDAVIPRIGTSVTFYGLAVVRQFESVGIFTTASSQAIAQSRDKLESLQLMTKAGLPIPRTAVVAAPENLYSAVNAVGGLPVVVKLIRGTQGRGVILADQLSTVSALLQRAGELGQQAMLQEFIAEAAGRDLRVIVVGKQCVAAMERHAAAGEFRANLHRGATAVAAALRPETARIAVLAARAHGLGVAGVDLVQSARGPLLLEVNSSPGLEGIEQTTGVDVAGAIIRYVEGGLAARRRF